MEFAPSGHPVDLAQLCVWGFVIFFFLLVWHLRREDKREGYPLELPRPEGGRIRGIPPPPSRKTYATMHLGEVAMPHDTLEGAEVLDPAPSTLPFLAATPTRRWHSRLLGAPLQPTGDPMRDGIGPAAFSARRDTPLLLRTGEPQVVPLRRAPGWAVTSGDPDPRGMVVHGADHVVAGEVVELWVDRGVKILRYLEVALAPGHAGRRVLVPIHFTDIRKRHRIVLVRALPAERLASVPALRDADSISAREEDRINAYFAGGQLYGHTDRREYVP